MSDFNIQKQGKFFPSLSLLQAKSESETNYFLHPEDFVEVLKVYPTASWILDINRQLVRIKFDIINDSEWNPYTLSMSAKAAINLIHPDDRQEIYNSFQNSVQKNTSFAVKSRINTAEECWIEIRGKLGSTLFSSSPFISGSVSEFTREKIEQNQLKEYYEQKVQKAELASKNKTSFLAHMSHEIRSPLSAILGFSEILSEEELATDKQKKYIEIILRNGNALAKLVDDVLDLSKVESGNLKLENLPFSFPDLIDEVGSLFEEKLKKKGLTFTNKIIGRFPEIILSDSSRIRQILINLLSNAIKFTEIGGITLTTQYRILGERQIEVKFKIRDTGIGLTDEQKGRLFTPYAQAEKSITRRFGGTGLGLALSKKLSQALDGDLTVDDTSDSLGACFRFTFKAEIPSPIIIQEQNLTPLQIAPLVPAPHAGRRVLIVEDSIDTQFLLERMLRGHGIKIHIANDGEEAIQKCMSQSYDLIFMDIKLPKIDGYEVTRILRSRGYSNPIVALTAHALENEKVQSVRAGCNGHLCKPINMQKLFSTLDQFLKQKS